MSIDPIRATSVSPKDPQEEKLRKVARDLEGVFVTELFKAMRETVPEGGALSGGMGEEMFTSMMDQHLAPLTAEGWKGGIGDALYRQLRGAIDGQAKPQGGTE
jgi:peptidoglycan hydrolase FlgJ